MQLYNIQIKYNSPQVRVIFLDEICKDCGQRGDERLLDFCHEKIEERKRKYLKFFGKKNVCSHCKKDWSR